MYVLEYLLPYTSIGWGDFNFRVTLYSCKVNLINTPPPRALKDT